MISLLACGTGFVLDILFGDPRWLYHPIRIIGHLISFLERCSRSVCGEDKKKLQTAGAILWIVTVLTSTCIPLLLLRLVGGIHPLFRYMLESFWCFQLLAAKSLKAESLKVYKELRKPDMIGARKAVSMIVGRDTENLQEAGIVRATVETVAENTSDGVIAPLFYMILGGAPLGFFYKAVNTMDSMIGYKDEKYLELGRCAAKLDDVFNYIPARLSALLMIAATGVLGMDKKQAWRIYRRDRKKHASPNAAQTESVCAGALGIRLAGDAWYFGTLYKKDYIGDELRPVEAEDIVRVNGLLYGTAILALFLFGAAKLFVLML